MSLLVSVLAMVGLLGLGTVGALWIRPMTPLLTAPPQGEACAGHERFDPVIWQDPVQASSERNPRSCMVDDLLSRHTLVGMTRAEIQRLLGKPPPTDYFREYDWVYWLGPERGFFRVDSEWLAIKFDAEGRVVQAKLVTD